MFHCTCHSMHKWFQIYRALPRLKRPERPSVQLMNATSLVILLYVLIRLRTNLCHGADDDFLD